MVHIETLTRCMQILRTNYYITLIINIVYLKLKYKFTNLMKLQTILKPTAAE